MAQGTITEKTKLVDIKGNPLQTTIVNGNKSLVVADISLRKLLIKIWQLLEEKTKNG